MSTHTLHFNVVGDWHSSVPQGQGAYGPPLELLLESLTQLSDCVFGVERTVVTVSKGTKA